MGRAPCCEKVGLKRGRWTTEEDERLMRYIQHNGEGSWRSLPKNAGLLRCGKSCRLRWLNYLRKDLKRGNISSDEENLIIKLHNTLGSRWSLIAGHLPGRTDNEIKNYWNSHLSRRIENFIRRPSIINSQSLPIVIDTTTKINGEHKQKGGRTSRATMKKKNNPNVGKSTIAKKTSTAQKENAAFVCIHNQEKNMIMSNNNLVMSSSIIPMQQNTEGGGEEMTTFMNMDPLSSDRGSVVLCCNEDRESEEEMLVWGPIDETEDRMIMSCPISNGGNITIENGVMSSNGILSCTEYTDQNGFTSFNESGVNTDIKTTTSVVDQVSFSTSNGGCSSIQNENGECYFTNSNITTSSSSSNNMTYSSFEYNLGVYDWDNWVGDILESDNNLLWEEIVGYDDLMLSCWLGGENQIKG